MEDAWCILGDFNSVLHPGDRIGGRDIQDAEIRQFAEFINSCEIKEMRSNDPYFWTRIDKPFVNVYWYDQYDFSHALYMVNSLSDHTALVIDTPDCPRPRSTFQFCDMWIRDFSFLPLVSSKMPESSHLGPFQRMKLFLRDTKIALQ